MKTISTDLLKMSIGISISMSILTISLILSNNVLAANIADESRNLEPVANFNIKTLSGMRNSTEGTIGTEFYFDARGSYDPERSQLWYMWDIDGDTKYEGTWSTEPTLTWKYYTLGKFDIKLLIRDDQGQVDSIIKEITLVKNTKPTPYFTVEPKQGSPAQEFRFDASGSYDDQYEERKLEYRWDFNGDGLYDTHWSSSKYVNHTYGSGFAGVYNVILQVRDPEDSRKTYSLPLEVLENTVPVAVVSMDPKVGTFTTIFRFDGSGSFDDETEFNDLKFRWDSEYHGPNDIIYDSPFSLRRYKQSVKFNEETQKVGRQKVRMEVQDEDGRIGTAIAYVDIHWASPYLKILNDEKVLFTRYDRYFNPNTAVPRGHVVQMILKKLNIKTSNNIEEYPFSDVVRSSKYGNDINTAYQLGLVEGYPDGTFKPNDPISRAETLAIIMRAFEISPLVEGRQFYPDVPKNEWFFKYVDTGSVYNLVSGYETGKFGPHDPITYGEIAKILIQASDLEKIN